jgi:hypothetical protein
VEDGFFADLAGGFAFADFVGVMGGELLVRPVGDVVADLAAFTVAPQGYWNVVRRCCFGWP